MSQLDTAARFRALHAPGNILVLPNAWDAASARVAEDCGATAIATSSAAVAWSHGYGDGEKMSKAVALSVVEDIVRVVRVPVSADSEAGYSDDPESVGEFVVALAHAGAVGINLEDGRSPPELLVEKIMAIKRACSRAAVDVFVNARTDVYLNALVLAENAVAESIARGVRYRAAGADGLFVAGVTDVSAMREISTAVDLPLNVLVRPGMVPIAQLCDAGVRRVSTGSEPRRAALGAYRRVAKELLEQGRYDTLYAEAEGCPNLNALMSR